LDREGVRDPSERARLEVEEVKEMEEMGKMGEIKWKELKPPRTDCKYLLHCARGKYTQSHVVPRNPSYFLQDVDMGLSMLQNRLDAARSLPRCFNRCVTNKKPSNLFAIHCCAHCAVPPSSSSSSSHPPPARGSPELAPN
jgi:hypothetical protein